MKRFVILAALVTGLGMLMPSTSSADLIGAAIIKRNPDLLFDNSGTYAFDAATNTVSISGDFLQGIFNNEDFTTQTGTQSLTISYVVDNSGSFAGGVAGDDLSISGTIDIDEDGTDDFSGVLLTGEIVDAGTFNLALAGGSGLLYDGIFDVTGGLLAGTLSLSSGVTTQGFHTLGVFIGQVATATTNPSQFGNFASTTNWAGTDVKVDVASTPEPSSLILLGMGAIGMCGYGWRRRQSRLAA